jgi:hypothetical protein
MCGLQDTDPGDFGAASPLAGTGIPERARAAIDDGRAIGRAQARDRARSSAIRCGRFAAFSDPSELAKWWGPEGFTIPSLSFQARVGERYRIEMQPPQGDAFHLTGEFRAVDPPERLAYTFAWEPADELERLIAART